MNILSLVILVVVVGYLIVPIFILAMWSAVAISLLVFIVVFASLMKCMVKNIKSNVNIMIG